VPLRLFSYRRPADIAPALRGLPPNRERLWLVGASGDRELLSAMLGDRREGRVVRWDELYRYFSDLCEVKNARVQIDPPDHWLLLNAILASRLAETAEVPPGARRRGFLDLASEQIHELLREEIAPEALERAFSPDDGAGALLTGAYRDYLAALDERGLSDSRGVTTETRKVVEAGPAEVCRGVDLVLAGFSSFTHSQLRLLRTLIGRGAAVTAFVPVAGLSGAYGAAQQFGVEAQELGQARPFAVTQLTGGDPRGELETIARSLLLWEQGEGPLREYGEWPGWGSVALSVPRASMPQARETAARYGLPCTWAFRLKVTETPLWTLASSCLDAASGGWGTEPVLRLLSLPWLTPAGLDVEALRGLRPRGVEGWRRALASGKEAAEAFEACLSFASRVAAGGTPLELLTALRSFAGARALAVSRLIISSPELDDAVGVFSQALRELDRKLLFIREVVRDLGRYGSQQLAGAEARAFLTAWADGTTVAQAEGGGCCMTVFADTPPSLYAASHFFIVGAEAGAWPGALRESPVLDEACKERLHASAELGLDRCHLPLLAEQRQMREFLFRRLLAVGSVRTFACHSAADDQDRPREFSSFIAAAARDGWIELNGEPIVRGLDGILPAAGEPALVPLECRAPDPAAGQTLPPVRVKPGSLAARAAAVPFSWVDDYAACPYFFALRHLLRVPEPPRDEEYDRLRGGTAVHAVWERAWREYAAGGAQSSIAALARGCFDEEVERVYPELLTQASLRRSLDRLRWQTERCAAFQDELEEQLRPLRVSIECEYPLPPLEVDGVTFSGRCDRLDRLRDGRFLLWDYKAGRSQKYTKAAQAACYALALEREGECGGWAFIGLSDAGLAGVWDDDLLAIFAPGAKKAPVKTGRLDEARALLAAIAAAAKAHLYPPKFDSKQCRVCAFAAMCRRGEFLGEEEEESDDDE